MSAVVVFTKHDFTVGTGDGVSELVAIPALLQDRCCNSKISRAARRRIIAEQICHLGPAKSKNPTVLCHRNRSNRCEMRFAERTKTLVVVKREQAPRAISGEHRRARQEAALEVECLDLSGCSPGLRSAGWTAASPDHQADCYVGRRAGRYDLTRRHRHRPVFGSGSTLIACEKTGRRCRAIELDPLYVEVILRRYQAVAGQAAVLENTGETFVELAARRQSEAAHRAHAESNEDARVSAS
jgi:hypothetical protein